jgi:segregation and condensation protein B
MKSNLQTASLPLEAKIEALLFFKSEPLSINDLIQLLNVDEKSIKDALETLRDRLSNSGVRLIKKDDRVTLGTAPEMADKIQKIVKEELEKDLGKAGLETLTIVLYRSPVTRASIDYIRGVNSSYILRHLLIRGLVERVQHKSDQRTFLYKPTFDLLRYLGIESVEELPEYSKVKSETENFEEQKKDMEDGEEN